MIAAALVLGVAGSLELQRAAALTTTACTGLGRPARRSFQGARRSGLAGLGMLAAATLLILLDHLGAR